MTFKVKNSTTGVEIGTYTISKFHDEFKVSKKEIGDAFDGDQTLTIGNDKFEFTLTSKRYTRKAKVVDNSLQGQVDQLTKRNEEIELKIVELQKEREINNDNITQLSSKLSFEKQARINAEAFFENELKRLSEESLKPAA